MSAILFFRFLIASSLLAIAALSATLGRHSQRKAVDIAEGVVLPVALAWRTAMSESDIVPAPNTS